MTMTDAAAADPGSAADVLSPMWWLQRLDGQLAARQATFDRYNDYYEGRHPLVFASPKFRNKFGALFSDFSDNWTELVVDAVEERLDVEGFRFGDPAGDQDAWGMWQANQMDAESQLAHTEALVNGESAVIVWADENGDPLFTVEHPSEVIVERAAGGRRRRLAALKRWVDETGTPFAILYLPDALWKFVGPRQSVTVIEVQGLRPQHLAGRVAWQPLELATEPWPLPNPLGVVPVVPLVNRRRMIGPGISEIRNVIPNQNAINKLVMDMLVASEFGAFRQRWVTGIELDVDPVTNQPLEPFDAAADRLWTEESAEARFGEFSQTDLNIIIAAIQNRIQSVASQTRTPPHYFYVSGQFPSGEALAVDTPVATPEGFRPIGDLAVGDLVFDPAGMEQVVEHAFAPMVGRPCYLVRFDDGTEIVADAAHKWETSHFPTSCSGTRQTGIVTTEEIAESCREQSHHWIPLATAPDYPSVALPIDPYVLGCWLGDGSSGHGHMTCHVDDVAHFANEWGMAGETLHVYAPAPDRPTIMRVHAGRNTDGATLRGRLNGLGVLHDKHIPSSYMLASAKDRLALLQGLMDTDGTVNASQGSVSFSQSRGPLSRQVLELVTGLGHKAAIAGDLSGRHGHRISWSALDVVFRLPRKVALQRTDWPDVGAGRRVRGRYIVSADPYPTVPVRCIQVSGPSHLFLATTALVATHNSIKSAETGLVAKARRKMRHFGESWEETLRLGFAVMGDARAGIMSAETIWADPESRSESEHVDAVMKRKSLNVPDEQLWEDAGYTPQQIDRFRGMAGTGDTALDTTLVEAVQKVYSGVGTVLTASEARDLLNRLGAGLDPNISPTATL